jgi:hypothetical protein
MNNIYIRDVLFDIMLYIDDASLRRLRVSNSQINGMIDEILSDPYFWEMKQLQEQELNYPMTTKKLKREQRFSRRRRYYQDYDYDADESSYEEEDNTYLDEYILPPREGSRYIYNKPILTKEQLDKEF